MNVTGIPGSYAELEQFLDHYDRVNLKHHPAGQALHNATRDLLSDRFPRWARPLARSLGDALLDPPLLAALGGRPPTAVVRLTAAALLALRKMVSRYRPQRTAPVFTPSGTAKSYPDGYAVDQLGPQRASAAHHTAYW